MAEIIHRITDRSRIAAIKTGQIDIDHSSEQADGLLVACFPGLWAGSKSVDFGPMHMLGTRSSGVVRMTYNMPRYGAMPALDFSGGTSGDEVLFPGDFPSVSDFTISCWANPASWIHSDNRYEHVVATGNIFSSSDIEFALTRRVHNSLAWAREWDIYIRQGGSLYGITATSADTYSPAFQWAHVLATWKNGEQHVYVNGIDRISDTIAQTPGTSTFPLRFGHPDSYDLTSYDFMGQLAEVRIYNKAVTADRQKDEYLRPWLLYKPRRSITYSIPTAPSSSTPYYFQRRRRVLS